MTMNRETLINTILAIAFVAVPIIAMGMNEPFIITLATKVAIFAMAGVEPDDWTKANPSGEAGGLE